MKLIQSVLILAFTCSASHAFGVAPPNQHQSQSASVSTSTTQLNESKLGNFLEQPLKHLGSLVLSSAIILNTAGVMSVAPSPAVAADSTVVGSLKGSGLVFKDTLNVERFEDPKVKGVVLYVSNFDRPVTEKLSGNFFNDPSQSSVACAKTGKVAIASNIAKGPEGEQVFKESRSILFKDLRVQRIYDEQENTVVYVSFSTRLDKSDDNNKSRFKSSLCAVNLNDEATSAPPAEAAQ